MTEPDAATPLHPAVITLSDRRRPGRPAAVSPDLLPLLRGRWQPPPEPRNRSDRSDLHAMRGVALGVLLSAPFWLGLAKLLR